MRALTFVIHQSLTVDFACGIAIPVSDETPAGVVRRGVGIGHVVAVQGIGFPSRIRTEIGRVIFQVGAQDGGHQFAKVLFLRLGVQYFKNLSGSAGRVQVVLQGFFYRCSAG